MKKIKITPILCCAPLAVLVFPVYRYYCVPWTPFALLAIGVFTLNMGILVLIDRWLVLWVRLWILCLAEAGVILLLILLKAWKSFLLWPLIN